MTLVPLLLVALVVVAACTGANGTADEPPTTTTSAATVTTTVTSGGATSGTATTTTSAGTVTTATTATTVTSTPPAGRTSTVRTDGGVIMVEARDGRLELVELTAHPGWTSAQQAPDPSTLLVTFERDGDRVEVRVELTDDGIRTETNATSRG